MSTSMCGEFASVEVGILMKRDAVETKGGRARDDSAAALELPTCNLHVRRNLFRERIQFGEITGINLYHWFFNLFTNDFQIKQLVLLPSLIIWLIDLQTFV